MDPSVCTFPLLNNKHQYIRFCTRVHSNASCLLWKSPTLCELKPLWWTDVELKAARSQAGASWVHVWCVFSEGRPMWGESCGIYTVERLQSVAGVGLVQGEEVTDAAGSQTGLIICVTPQTEERSSTEIIEGGKCGGRRSDNSNWLMRLLSWQWVEVKLIQLSLA